MPLPLCGGRYVSHGEGGGPEILLVASPPVMSEEMPEG